MSVEIKRVVDQGVEDRERLVLRILANDDIGRYVVLAVHVEDDLITNAVDDVFWFPDQPVKAGDLVVLYTKAGTPTTKSNKNGSTSHFFYWGIRNSALWAQYGAVLIEAASWSFRLPEPTNVGPKQ